MPPIKRPPRKRSRTFFREWRDHLEKKQNQVAAEIGVSNSTLGHLENGDTPYSQDMVEALAAIYECTPAALISVDPRKIEKEVNSSDPNYYAKDKTSIPDDLFLEAVTRAIEGARLAEQEEGKARVSPRSIAQVALEIAHSPLDQNSELSPEAQMLGKARSLCVQFLRKEQR